MVDIRETFGWDGSKGRRKLAADKLELYDSKHLARLQQILRAHMADPVAREQALKWANTSRNLCRQITETVAIAYSRGTLRDLHKAAGTPAAEAFASIVVESGISEAATLINAYSWLLGPTLVVPQLTAAGRLYLSIVPPSASEIVRADDPEIATDVLYQREDELFIRLDAEGWSYFDSEGEPIKGLAPIRHGLGYVPAAVFRSRHWTGDWWNSWEHRALVDASYAVAVYEALMDWTTKNGVKQLVVKSPRDENAGDQVFGIPELPLWLDTTPDRSSVEVVDLTQATSGWLDKINAKVAGVCELYGLPPSLLSGVNNTQDWGQVGLARSPEVLDSLRDKQIPWLKRGELQLWPAICDLVRASPTLGIPHKHASALPPGDEVRDMLRMMFLEQERNEKRRLDRLKVFDAEESLGLTCVTDLLLEQRPELTREQADEIIAGNLERRNARLEEQTRRSQPATTREAMESLSQVQGRLGGLTRAANEAPDETAADNAA